MKSILFNIPVPITTPRLILKPPQINDGLMLNNAILESFDTLKEFMPWAETKPSVEDSEEFARNAAANWILKHDFEPLPLFIFDRNEKEFIGSTGYVTVDWTLPAVEIGYWIRNKYSGLGLMTEAVHALTLFGFAQLKVNRITILCDVNNYRSKGVAERLDYQLEGVLKANRRKPKSFELTDTLVYARYGLDGLPSLAVSWSNA